MELDDARAPVELLVAEELGHKLLLGEDDGKAAEGAEACEAVASIHPGSGAGWLRGRLSERGGGGADEAGIEERWGCTGWL